MEFWINFHGCQSSLGNAAIPSEGVTKGNFNSPRVAKPQVVGIEIDLSDSGEFTIPAPPPEGIFIVLWEVETSIIRDWVTIPYS